MPRSIIRGRAILCVFGLALLSAGAQSAPTVAIITSNSTPVVGGAAFSFTITVNNPDAIAANNLRVSLPLPPSMLFQNLAISGTGGGGFDCTHPGQAENGLILCEASALAAGASAVITIVASVDPVNSSGVRTAAARLVVGTTATTATIQSNLQVNAPLSVTISGPSSATRGERVSYLLLINNVGDSTAINATFSAILPVGFSHFSAQGTGALANTCDYTGSTRTLTCSSIAVPKGFSKLTWTAEIAASAPTGGALVSFGINNAGTGTIAVGSSSTITTVN